MMMVMCADTTMAWTTPTAQNRPKMAYPSSQKRNSSLQSNRRRRDVVRVYSNKKDDDDDKESRVEKKQGGSWRDYLPIGKDEEKKDIEQDDKKKGSGSDENPFSSVMGWIRRNQDDDDDDDNGSPQQGGDKNDSSEEARKQKEKEQRKKELLAAKQKVKSAKKEESTTKKEEDDNSIPTKIKSMFFAMLPRDDNDKDKDSNEKSKKQNRKQQQQSRSRSSPLSVVQKIFQSDDDDEEWVTVFPKTRIMPGEQVPVTVAGIDLLVVASNDGRNRLYCIANACPHLGTPLETGQLVRLPAVESSSSSKTRNSSSSNRSKTSTPQQQPIVVAKKQSQPNQWTETEVSSILQQDGCENCIVCPLHRTAFALESGEVRGEWCPYPPIIGKMVGIVKEPTPVATFDIRTKGKDVQVRLNSPIENTDGK